jgi:hypothetical protein
MPCEIVIGNAYPCGRTSTLACLFHGFESSTLSALKDAHMAGETQKIVDIFEVRFNSEFLLGESMTQCSPRRHV